MSVGYLECFAGISGDMLLGALVDAGVDPAVLEDAVRALEIGTELRFTSVNRSGIQATKADVLVAGRPAEEAARAHTRERSHKHGHEPEHEHSHGHKHEHDGTDKQDHAHGESWQQIRGRIERAPLTLPVRALALRAFGLLAQAEARVHNLPVEDVHFHEVGSVDTICDIVAASAGLVSLGVTQWFTGPINTGSGFVDCAHGRFPVPAPATAELLKRLPVYADGPSMEMVTPTGAAMLRALEVSVTVPAIASTCIGYGAGTRDPHRFPNVLRLTLGETSLAATSPAATGQVNVVECAIDDASPQVIAHAMQLALDHGALDVLCSPVTMKKNRAGVLLSVLAPPEQTAVLQQLLLRETTTLGLRTRSEQRIVLERGFTAVETPYGPIRIKTGFLGGEMLNAMPEYEDCAAAAAENHAPLKLVMQAALAAFYESKARA